MGYIQCVACRVLHAVEFSAISCPSENPAALERACHSPPGTRGGECGGGGSYL